MLFIHPYNTENEASHNDSQSSGMDKETKMLLSQYKMMY